MDDRIRAAFDAIHAEETLKEHTKAALAARQRPAVRRRRLAPLLACLALVVALQVWLCRKGKWLGLILPALRPLMQESGQAICLVKPQFEAGREKVGKNGVVRDPATHREVLHSAMGYAAANGFVVRGLDFSPVKGPEGNIEYLMFVQKSAEPAVLDDSVAKQVVEASHSTLDR